LHTNRGAARGVAIDLHDELGEVPVAHHLDAAAPKQKPILVEQRAALTQLVD